MKNHWNHRSITPIFKSGDKSQVTNYRPISLLCIVSKVLEHLIYKRVSKFLTDNNILSHQQFGFRQHHSTTQQLLIFLTKVLNALNNYPKCDVIYLDFKKAFDSVPHQELLLKLWKVGVVGSLWRWLREYLSNRCQRVCINNSDSSTRPVISSVPQGSLLGPLLFLVYINDLPPSLKHSESLLFADDTKCLRPICSPHDCIQLQSDLDALSSWSTKWKLLFNETKCSLLSIASGHAQTEQSEHQYFINDQPISTSNLQKDLGIIMSSSLSWSYHISKITSKAYKILGLLRRTFGSTNNVTTKKRLYISLVRSQLLYGSQIWRPLQLKDMKSIESLQRRATKYILNDYTSDYRSRLIKLELLPLSMVLELNDICFFVKSLKLSSDNSGSFDITKYATFSRNQTRSRNYWKLVQPLIRNNRDKQFYFNRIPYLWNSLPPIDLSLSYITIKRKLKEIFWDSFLANFNPDNNCTFYYKCPCPCCFSHPKSCFASLLTLSTSPSSLILL